MNPAQITDALQKRDVTQVDIALSVELPPSSRTLVSMVIRRLSRSRRVEEAISKAAQIPLHVLWPEWYSADGTRLKARRRRHD